MDADCIIRIMMNIMAAVVNYGWTGKNIVRTACHLPIQELTKTKLLKSY